MIIGEDGGLTGSIDVSRLDEVEPKSDEAKAQLEQLKRERDEGQKLTQADADRAAELHRTQSFEGQRAAQDEPAKDNRDVQGKSVGSTDQGAQAEQADQADQKSQGAASKRASSSSRE